MNPESTILVGVTNRQVWVKVEGKGSFQNSPGLKELAREMIGRGSTDFYVDLAHCTLMDSTFMGTLAGIALRLREQEGGVLHVINTNARNDDLLRNLGLDQLFQVVPAQTESPVGDVPLPIPPPGASPSVPILSDTADKVEQAETMLEAHEALVAASPANYLRFKDVLEFLQQDLGKEDT